MNYRSAVAEAKQLVKRSEEDQWRLAELTFEVVQSGKSQRQWAKDVGRSQPTVRLYLKIWERWGDSAPYQRPPFPEAYNGAKEGSEEPLTRAESRGRREERQVPTRPEDRIEMAAKLLADVDVAAAVVRNTKAMAKIAEAEQERVEDTRSQQTRSATRSVADEWDVSGDLFRARKFVVLALKKAKAAGSSTKATRSSWLDDAKEVRVALDWFESLVESGDSSWEQALEEWSEAQ